MSEPLAATLVSISTIGIVLVLGFVTDRILRNENTVVEWTRFGWESASRNWVLYWEPLIIALALSLLIALKRGSILQSLDLAEGFAFAMIAGDAILLAATIYGTKRGKARTQ